MVGGDAGTTTGTEQDAVERIRARRADAPEGLRPPWGAAWGAARVNFVRDFAGGDYPVNRLRNEALRGCAALGARWAITLDVDFMPNAGGYTHLLGLARELLAGDPPGTREALVVPAFEAADAVVGNTGRAEEILSDKAQVPLPPPGPPF